MFSYAFLRFLFAFTSFYIAFIRFHTLIYAFIHFLYAFIHFLYAFIRFYMLLYAFIGQTVRTTTRDAASLSNRLLPAEAGKKSDETLTLKIGN